MKKVTFAALAALTITACSSGPKFQVNGDISGAEGKMLYLESSALEGIVPLDSVKLKGNGTFSFSQARPESPEFYRLRIEDKVINFSVDSIESIQIKAPYTDFSTAYTVEGSDNSKKIKELTIKQIQLQKDVDNLLEAVRNNKITHDTFDSNLNRQLTAYKEDVKKNYIFAAPNTAAAYFALFQKLNNYLIFDPLNNKEDIKCFAAVATSLNNMFPHAVRSKNLYNIVIKGMKNTRQPQAKAADIPQEKIVETGIIDIALRDIKGNVRKLADLKGIVADTYLNCRCTELERKHTLDAVSRHFHIDLYTQSDSSMLPHVQNCGIADSERVMPKIFKCSKINLNITLRSIKSGIPQRAFDIMGCGGFLLSNYQPEMAEYFIPGKDLVLYDSVDDLIQKIDYYLSHEEERLQIAKNGYEKVKRYHTYDTRLTEILNTVISD